MNGPLILAVVAGAAGWVAGGPSGLVGGLIIAAVATMGVAVGALVWARQAGPALGREQAREHAPCLPGFSRICDYIYDRELGFH